MSHVETYINGLYYPSVTTIIGAQEKPWLKDWREKWGSLAERKMEIASEIGTCFHDCIEQYFDRGYWAANIPNYPSCQQRVNGMMKSFVTWAESVDGEVIVTEMKVISKQYIYSGTLDCIIRFKKVLVVVDWKTSSRIYDDMGLQLSAYASAYKEEGGEHIKEGRIVHISKDKPSFKLTTKSFKLGKRLFNKFLKLREMFDDVRRKETV
jgi:PD-(D/E)XK nuclease superfamily